MSCDACSESYSGAPPKFQSLSGFRMSCDSVYLDCYDTLGCVSIPIGFSNELRPSLDIREPPIWLVSIPIGFSNELRQYSGVRGRLPGDVSIPIGFSNELRPVETALRPDAVQVSIPIGFSNELRRVWCPPGRLRGRCFNPYRVFE